MILFGGPDGSHQVVGPRRDANVANEERYFNQLGHRINAQPSAVASGLGPLRSSHGPATSPVDEPTELDEDWGHEVDGVFGDDDGPFDGLI